MFVIFEIFLTSVICTNFKIVCTLGLEKNYSLLTNMPTFFSL